MTNFLTKEEIIQKLQSLPDLPVVVQLESLAGIFVQVSSVEIIDVSIDSNGHFNYTYAEPPTHKVILIS
jgi:hypothetical protein